MFLAIVVPVKESSKHAAVENFILPQPAKAMRLVWGRRGGEDEVQWQQDGIAVGGKKRCHGRSAFDHARVALCPLADSFQLMRHPTIDCEDKPTWTLFLGDVCEDGCNLKIACTGQQRGWENLFATEPSLEQVQAFSGNLPERKGMQGTGDQVDELIRSWQVEREGRTEVLDSSDRTPVQRLPRSRRLQIP
jgi:hypothetical protein